MSEIRNLTERTHNLLLEIDKKHGIRVIFDPEYFLAIGNRGQARKIYRILCDFSRYWELDSLICKYFNPIYYYHGNSGVHYEPGLDIFSCKPEEFPVKEALKELIEFLEGWLNNYE